jgi:cell division protein FtsZ
MQGVSGITDLITTPGLINLDFADVKSDHEASAGSALMGIGSARGEDRSQIAAEMAISSPLLEASIDGAHGVLLSVAGGSDLGLFEVSEAARLLIRRCARRRPTSSSARSSTTPSATRCGLPSSPPGFDGGAPLPRLSTPNRASVTDGFVSKSAMSGRDSADLTRSEEVGRPLAPATRAVSFEDSPARSNDADDLDVPDFLK